MYVVVSIVGVVVAVLLVAVGYDLRARRHRRLFGDFSEAARNSTRSEVWNRRAQDARTRPSKTFGRGSGPPIGPPGL